MSRPPLNFEGRRGKLHANGERFHVKGANWFGSEGFLNHAPYGLHRHSVSWYMSFLAKNKFNALRFFFTHKAVLENQVIPEAIHGLGYTDEHQVDQAPELAGKTYIEMLTSIIRTAAKHGILVMLANHRLTPDSPAGKPGSGLWYNDEVPIHEVKRSWARLAEVLCGEGNAWTADVQNEPYKAEWGTGDASHDWRLGAEGLGNHVLNLCPRWLIFIQGIADEPGAPSSKSGEYHFFGENLCGARDHPVRLRDPSKLVLSPHIYGPDSPFIPMEYWSDPTYPSNLPEICERHSAAAYSPMPTPPQCLTLPIAKS